jgi:hypothetical protein
MTVFEMDDKSWEKEVELAEQPVQEIVGAVYPTLLKKLIEESLEFGKKCLEKSTPVRFDMAYA